VETADTDFCREIERLAEGAVVEARKGVGPVRRRPRRRISILIGAGALLALAEVALLIVQLRISHQQRTATGSRSMSRPVSVGDCRSVLYDTYRGVVAYMHDQGHPPGTLSELIGKYAERLPSDPRTRQSLLYSSDGRRFSLRCPEPTV
jgi:hypothetical protein